MKLTLFRDVVVRRNADGVTKALAIPREATVATAVTFIFPVVKRVLNLPTRGKSLRVFHVDRKGCQSAHEIEKQEQTTWKGRIRAST